MMLVRLGMFISGCYTSSKRHVSSPSDAAREAPETSLSIIQEISRTVLEVL